MAKYPPSLVSLIEILKKLPGVGSKTAERFAFHLLDWEEGTLKHFANNLHSLKEEICFCSQCSCLMEKDLCSFCSSSQRDPRLLCILSSAKDVFVFEETRSYQGMYHVLGSLLSPLDGRGVEHLNLSSLTNRIQLLNTQEVILALDFTLEGDATALYLKEFLKQFGIKVSRLAFGLPLGSPLEYVDQGTLSRAFTGRQSF